MRNIPPIKAVMTPFPYSVEIDRGVGAAREIMASHRIRHLPVIENGQLVSVITDRDLRLARNRPPGDEEPLVRELCVREAYTVDLLTPLDEVLLRMAEAHLDSALVIKDGRLVGIFTTTDVCRRFREFLRTLFPPGHGDDAA